MQREPGAAGMHEGETAQAILAEVQRLRAELRPNTMVTPAVTLDTRLEHDVGLDSLGRLELIARLERSFGVGLPEQTLVQAETVRDLLRAVRGAAAAPAPGLVHSAPPAVPLGTATPPEDAVTLTEVLAWQVAHVPDRPHIYWITESDHEEILTYADLHRGAEAVAGGLLAGGLSPGQAVAIMLPTGRDYFFAFYGALLAGGVPVPIYPPTRAAQIEEHLQRHARILDNAAAGVLITIPEVHGFARLLRWRLERLRRITTVAELEAAGPAGTGPPRRAQDIALLQYTSGSTGHPKGVVLTHANLLANIRAMGRAVQAGADDVFVSWMPLYHDMGLIGAWLGSLYHAFPLVVMSPLLFLTRPERWLWAIHRHRGTISGAPNFGYELCVRRVEDRALEGLDLSSWRLAFNGAEAVSADTLARFQKRFAPYGLRPDAQAPVYGLAECAVGLAFPPLHRAPLIDRVRREPFARSGRAEPAATDDPQVLRFVACGRPLPGHQIRIVDGTGYEVGERQEGRLEFKGPSATSGYFRNPEDTRALFHGEWLDSGDLAYTDGADVYLTGRVKDIIVRAGRNIYPQELEEAVGNVAGIRRGCVAVFGSVAPGSGTERVVVLAETRETDPAVHERLRAQIAELAIDRIGAPPEDIVLAPPHTVLKTSSGKIRRAASRDLYERGRITARAPGRWLMFTRSLGATLAPRWRRAVHALGAWLYAAYAWALFYGLAPVVWLAVAALPRPAWRWRLISAAARSLVRLSRTPLTVRGLERLPPGPCVLVANHQSYLDGVLLAAVLPRLFRFVAKRELGDRFIPRVFLRRIDAQFVERFDARRGVTDLEALVETLRAGEPLVFFPEGTFGRASGLMPFHLGAFATAAQAGVPTVPVAIRGTRSILRDGQWFPRRGAVNVTFGEPLAPAGADWPALLALRDAARAEILRHCGEPDLAGGPPAAA